MEELSRLNIDLILGLERAGTGGGSADNTRRLRMYFLRVLEQKQAHEVILFGVYILTKTMFLSLDL